MVVIDMVEGSPDHWVAYLCGECGGGREFEDSPPQPGKPGYFLVCTRCGTCTRQSVDEQP